MNTKQDFENVGKYMQELLDILNPILSKNPEDSDESIQILAQLQEKFFECCNKKWWKSEIIAEFKIFSDTIFASANISQNSQNILQKKSDQYVQKLEEIVIGNILDIVKSKNFWKGFGSILDFSVQSYKK